MCVKRFIEKHWGSKLTHKERMQLPLHRAITFLMTPCYLLQRFFYLLASICRDRRLDKEIKKLMKRGDKQVSAYQCAIKIAKEYKQKSTKKESELKEMAKKILKHSETGDIEAIKQICFKILEEE
ncbi:MAG: hypothetical protein RBR26_07365 [Methanosarcina mazei]|nr:hypothetical protein [Methanosarcina mazei]